MPAFFKDSISGQSQVAESATYPLNAGGSVSVDFLAPAAGCDSHGQNCGNSPDPNASAYGSLMVQYVADNPAALRGIAQAQLTLLANVTSPDSAWQTTEREVPAANMWTAPVSVSAKPGSNPQTTQEASAALANPGPSAITVRGTLYDKNGLSVAFRDSSSVSGRSRTALFSGSSNPTAVGPAMFPQGRDQRQVAFQVISPGGAPWRRWFSSTLATPCPSVEMNSQGLSSVSSSAAPDSLRGVRNGADGSCPSIHAA
jgi:hypothetical protein